VAIQSLPDWEGWPYFPKRRNILRRAVSEMQAKTFGKTYTVGRNLPKAKDLGWKPQKNNS